MCSLWPLNRFLSEIAPEMVIKLTKTGTQEALKRRDNLVLKNIITEVGLKFLSFLRLTMAATRLHTYISIFNESHRIGL